MAGVRARTAGRTVDASLGADAAFAGLLAAGTLVIAWLASYAAGGSHTALPHAFYIPVIICSIRFCYPGALLAAIAAAIAAGPFLPLNVDLGTAQSLDNWLARGAAFAIVGVLTAYLSRHSLPSLSAEIATRRFRHELEAAVTAGQIHLDYQPLIDLRDGNLIGVEALVRWEHPERGTIPPDQFIPEAERSGCINLITRRVITDACRQVATWRNERLLAGHHGFTLAVNVSAADLTDPTLCDHISTVLADTNLPPHWLHLEITETALVNDIDTVIDRLMDLRLLGLRIAIDDFGTGESSLSHLQQYPVDILKIDRTFIARLEHRQRGDVLAHGIIALAHAMDLTTIAEGIETPHQARLVREFGCNIGQGYLFSRPVGSTALAAILEHRQHFARANTAHLDTGMSAEGRTSTP